MGFNKDFVMFILVLWDIKTLLIRVPILVHPHLRSSCLQGASPACPPKNTKAR